MSKDNDNDDDALDEYDLYDAKDNELWFSPVPLFLLLMINMIYMMLKIKTMMIVTYSSHPPAPCLSQ